MVNKLYDTIIETTAYNYLIIYVNTLKDSDTKSRKLF